MDMCCVCKEGIAGTYCENSNHFFLQVCSPLMAFSLCVSSLVMSALQGLVVQPELSSAFVNSSSRYLQKAQEFTSVDEKTKPAAIQYHLRMHI